MCISGPKPGAGSPPPPTQLVADQLQLGTTAVQQRQAGQLGRAALTANTQTAQRQVTRASAPTPTGATVATSPAGTLGLPTNYTGAPVYGGLKPKAP